MIETPMQEAKRKAGGTTALARALDVTIQAISQWGDTPPPKRCVEIERITGVERARLRPDLFGPSEAA